MKTQFRIRVLLAIVSLLASVGIAVGQVGPVVMTNRETATVESASRVLSEIMSIPGRSIPASLLSKAEGIAIIPGMIKGGFVIGVRHGRGVIVTRDEAGQWKAPLFLEITGGSVGWQAGVQGTDLVLVFRTKSSLLNLMRGKFTIGANAAAAAGPLGREAQASTDAALKAEILSYSRSRGLFAGVALDGAALSIDHAATNNYYQSSGNPQPGQPASVPPSAVALVQQIARYTAVVAPPANAAPPVGMNSPGIGTSVPVDPQALRRQLADSSKQLATILDVTWRTYLALPAEVYSGNQPPSAEVLRVTLDRFNSTAADPRFQELAQRAEFKTTWSLLRQYAATVQPANSQPLTLPPPPGN